MHRQIVATKAQLCCGNYKTVLVSGAHFNGFYSSLSLQKEDRAVLASKFMRVVFPPWGKLYDARIIKDHNILFPISMPINDDTYFVTDYITKCDRLATVSDSVYYYNHLNIGSITGKYHGELNRCYALGISRRLEMFDVSNLPDEEQLTIAELFLVALKHYVVHLSSEEALSKLEETHELFGSYLRLLHPDVLERHKDSPYAQAYLFHEKALKAGNYKDVYLCLSEETKKVSGLNRKLRNMILPILQFFVFKLQLGYKK